MPNTYLAHHGILGQKWGVRRFQNEDGSLTAAGKERYLKADGSFNRKGQKAASALAKNGDASGLRNMIKSAGTYDKQIDEVKTLREKHHKALSEYMDAEEPIFDKVFKAAYEETYKWFEKNEPDYLAYILENNDGSKDGLDAFHDFRKTQEGFADDLDASIRSAYYKDHPEVEQLEERYNATGSEYARKATSLGKAILGNTKYESLALHRLVGQYDLNPLGSYYDKIFI